MLEIKFRNVSNLDVQKLLSNGFDNAKELLENKVVIEAIDDDSNQAILFFNKETYLKLGEDFIKRNLQFSYSKSLGDYIIKIHAEEHYKCSICLTELSVGNGMMSSNYYGDYEITKGKLKCYDCMSEHCNQTNCLQCDYITNNDYRKCHYFNLKEKEC